MLIKLNALRITDENAPNGSDIFDIHELQVGDYWIDHKGAPNRVLTDNSSVPLVVWALQAREDEVEVGSVGWISFFIDDRGIFLNTAWTERDYRHEGVFDTLFREMVARHPWLEVRGLFVNPALERYVESYNTELREQLVECA